MERRIDPDALLDYVELQIYPSHNRYEACVSSSNIVEKVASGDLQQLLMHLPPVRDLSSKSSDSNFKILAPEDFNDNSWFTTATLRRFLQIVSSPDFLTIGNEISQLEETRKFQLSLFAKAEVDMTSSFESKNELLHTVDLRLSELKKNLSNALNQATSTKCSPKDISSIENLSHHFGAEDIRDSLQKLLESSDLEETNHTTTEKTTPFPTSQISPPVKYGVSPAKAAQMERQLSSDSDSSFSSEEDNHSPPPPIERSRTPARSSASRRSASPMRRIQIGRGGPRRPAILNIKSLNYPKSTQRDESGQSSQDEDEETERIAKQNALRLSVQDRISLFESKKKEEKDKEKDVEIQKPKIVEKAVLRRWSSGMSVSREKDEIVPEVVEKTKSSSPEEVADVAVDDSKSKQESREKDVTTWSEQKEAELNQLFTKMMESKKPVRRHSVTNDNSKSKSKSITKEQRGGFYDSYKQKRDEKLRKEVGKRAEKEEKFKEMEQFLDDKKAEIVSSKIKPKTNVTKVINPKKETIKAPVKKITNKSSQLPVTRKSWPSAPSPKPTVTPSPTRKTQPTSPAVRPNPVAKVEKSKPQLKTLKPSQPDAKKIIKPAEKKQTTGVKSAKPKPRTKVDTSVGPTTTAVAKPSFYKKVTKKSSVVPMETKPFLRKGTGIGPGGGAVVAKSKVAAQPLVTEFEPVEAEKNNTVETKCELVMETVHEKKRNCDILIIGDEDSEEDIDSNIVHEELQSCDQNNLTTRDDGVNVINKMETVDDDENGVEEELMISPTAWVEKEEDREDEIVVCEERGVGQVAGGVANGGGSARVRHSLFQMLLEETGEGESGEWGNAQPPPVQKDAPKGFKRLLKFARKTKADLLLTDGSSPSSIFRRG